MNQFNQIVEDDPLKFKRFDQGYGYKTSKILYILLAVIPACFILSLVFFIIGSTTELKDIPKVTTLTQDETQGSSMTGDGASANVAEQLRLANLQGNATSTKIQVLGEVFTDRTKIADSFSKIQIGLRIMPSQNDEAGIIIMKTTDEANKQDSKLGSKVDLGENYFLMTDTSDYFPVMRVSQENGPIGSASPLCIHLDWAKNEHKKMVDMYRSVLGFPNCTNAFNQKFRWQKSDPSTGVDFKAWKQQVQKVESEGDCRSLDGIFIKNGGNKDSGKCFTYQVLQRICLMVAFKVHPKTSSYYWEYRGGCYGSGDIGVYEKAIPGTDYKFDSIPIEVREDESLYVSVGNFGSQARNLLTPIFYFFAYIFMFLAVISVFGFIGLFARSWKLSQPGNAEHFEEQVDEVEVAK